MEYQVYSKMETLIPRLIGEGTCLLLTVIMVVGTITIIKTLKKKDSDD